MIQYLHIPIKNQDTLNYEPVFRISISNADKQRYGIYKTGNIDIWFYKDLEKNKKDYLEILTSQIVGTRTNKTKQEMCQMLENRLVFEKAIPLSSNSSHTQRGTIKVLSQ
jgi:hypothetical protein